MVFNFNRKICGQTSILGNTWGDVLEIGELGGDNNCFVSGQTFILGKLRVNSNGFDANNEIVLLDSFNPSSQDEILDGKISSFAAEDVCIMGLCLMVKLDLLFGLEKTWRWIGLHFTPNNADGSVMCNVLIPNNFIETKDHCEIEEQRSDEVIPSKVRRVRTLFEIEEKSISQLGVKKNWRGRKCNNKIPKPCSPMSQLSDSEF
ncbi:hypothetical protein GOBAR_DD19073 [Gossypium barbadense]|nr:hypothetical protein GOBAR_DD19073 [Gossypium barbadense]